MQIAKLKPPPDPVKIAQTTAARARRPTVVKSEPFGKFFCNCCNLYNIPDPPLHPVNPRPSALSLNVLKKAGHAQAINSNSVTLNGTMGRVNQTSQRKTGDSIIIISDDEDEDGSKRQAVTVKKEKKNLAAKVRLLACLSSPH